MKQQVIVIKYTRQDISFLKNVIKNHSVLNLIISKTLLLPKTIIKAKNKVKKKKKSARKGTKEYFST